MYQMAIISLFRCVSMSTRQMGQCLLVTSHWSTQSMWNKCMHGRRLKMFQLKFIYQFVDSWLEICWISLLSLTDVKQEINFQIHTEHRFPPRKRTSKWCTFRHRPRLRRFPIGDGRACICAGMCFFRWFPGRRHAHIDEDRSLRWPERIGWVFVAGWRHLPAYGVSNNRLVSTEIFRRKKKYNNIYLLIKKFWLE